MELTVNWRKFLGMKRSRSQLCLVGTDDGRIVTAELEVPTGCLVQETSGDAFLSDPENQMRSRGDGHWYQILSERSIIPISPVAPISNETIKRLKKLVNRIFHESQEKEKLRVYKAAADEKFKTWIIALVSSAVIVAILLGIWRFYQGNK